MSICDGLVAVKDIGLAQVEVERSRMQLAALKEQLGNLMELESETINPR